MKNRLSKKLENYEQSAYEGGIGGDWLAEIGEGFKFYILDCEKNNIKPTISGWVKWIDELAIEKLK